MRIRVAALAVLTSVLGACNQSDAKKGAEQAPSAQEAPSRPMLGVYPDRFQCESVVPLADLGAALGGTAAVNDSAGAPPPKNVARGCNYRVTIGAGDAGVQEAWGYDLDCRPDYQKRVDLLFQQYTQQSADLVTAYNAKYHSKPPPPNDAGMVQRVPTDAKEVAVGRRGLDHNGNGLLFIDDDAPCYVRVVGPDADRRLIVAKLVADRLHEANAPMTPHLGPK
jgi:hypothetical protein